MIPVKKFLEKVEEIALESPSYRIGGTGKDGTCDCIGLIIGAIRRAGGEWSGLKGSNYAARNEVLSLQGISVLPELSVGEVVFKARNRGEKGYDADTIRRRYSSSPDQRDYYHIGVVLSVYPLRICHMTTPAPKIDTTLGKWSFHGWLKKVAGGETDSPANQPTATPQSPEQIPPENTHPQGGDKPMQTVALYGGILTSPINLRLSDSMRSPIVSTVPQYSVLELISSGKEWTKVRYEHRDVYVQSVFVHPLGESFPDSSDQPLDADPQIYVSRKRLEAIYDEIGDWLGLRG